jgi:predicted ribosome-associated RNA-binding protein Tma20
MSSNVTNNPNFQKLNINNEIDQIDINSKMNQISLQSKIKLNLDCSVYKYLNLKDRTFIIYTEKEILLFDKKQNYTKIFPSNSDKKKKTDIKFVKYINKEKLYFLINMIYIYQL